MKKISWKQLKLNQQIFTLQARQTHNHFLLVQAEEALTEAIEMRTKTKLIYVRCQSTNQLINALLLRPAQAADPALKEILAQIQQLMQQP